MLLFSGSQVAEGSLPGQISKKNITLVLPFSGRNIRTAHRRVLDAGNDFMALSGGWRVYQTAYAVHILTDKQDGGKDSAYL
jgi:hypothetical protein